MTQANAVVVGIQTATGLGDVVVGTVVVVLRCECSIGGGPLRQRVSRSNGVGLVFIVAEVIGSLHLCLSIFTDNSDLGSDRHGSRNNPAFVLQVALADAADDALFNLRMLVSSLQFDHTEVVTAANAPFGNITVFGFGSAERCAPQEGKPAFRIYIEVGDKL